MKRKLNQNSQAAYKMLHENMKSDHWGKILFAMRLLGISCSSEAIAKKAGMKESQIYRRMGELVINGLVYVSGKGLTSSGRPCALYSLTQHCKEKQELDWAKNQQPKEEIKPQATLF